MIGAATLPNNQDTIASILESGSSVESKADRGLCTSSQLHYILLVYT